MTYAVVMGLKDRLGEWTRKARERATDAAVDQAKLRAKDAVTGASKLLGNLVFGKDEAGASTPPLGDEKERSQALEKWETAKTRFEQRERDAGDPDKTKRDPK